MFYLLLEKVCPTRTRGADNYEEVYWCGESVPHVRAGEGRCGRGGRHIRMCAPRARGNNSLKSLQDANSALCPTIALDAPVGWDVSIVACAPDRVSWTTLGRLPLLVRDGRGARGRGVERVLRIRRAGVCPTRARDQHCAAKASVRRSGKPGMPVGLHEETIRITSLL